MVLRLDFLSYILPTNKDNKANKTISGVWTPYIGGSTTAGTIVMESRPNYYLKLDKFIFLSMDATIQSMSVSPTGQIRISGLPFVSNTGSWSGSHAIYSTGFNIPQNNAIVNIYGLTHNGANRIDFYNTISDDVRLGVGTADCSLLSDTTCFRGSIAYFTNG